MLRIDGELPTLSVVALVCAVVPVTPAVLGAVISVSESRANVSSGVCAALLFCTTVALIGSFVAPSRRATMAVTAALPVLTLVSLSVFLSRYLQAQAIVVAFSVLTVVSLMAVCAYATFIVTMSYVSKKYARRDSELNALNILMPSSSIMNDNIAGGAIPTAPELGYSPPTLSSTNYPNSLMSGTSRSTSIPEKLRDRDKIGFGNDSAANEITITPRRRIHNKASQSSSITLGDSEPSTNNSTSQSQAQSGIHNKIKGKHSISSVLSFLQPPEAPGSHSPSGGKNNLLFKFPHGLLATHHISTGSKSQVVHPDSFSGTTKNGHSPKSFQFSELSPKVDTSPALSGDLDSWEVNSLEAKERLLWSLANADAQTTGNRSVSGGSSGLSTTSDSTGSPYLLNNELNDAGFTKVEAIIDHQRRSSYNPQPAMPPVYLPKRAPSLGHGAISPIAVREEDELLGHRKQLSQYDLERLSRTFTSD
uniref:ARAD1D24266p n=1 Tax=Blastobotrys adeninivorans TaxID=409370 RepID=A0A060TAI4_BLAAD